MRVWWVPYRELDDQRVLGQHSEVHALGTMVCQNGQRWGTNTFPEPEWPALLYECHQAILAEMAVRWGRFRAEQRVDMQYIDAHATPWKWPTETVFWPNEAGYKKLLERDRTHLVARWDGVYRGRGEMPEEYEPIIAEYKERGGCLHESWTETLPGGGQLCLDCKRWVLVEDKRWIPRDEYLIQQRAEVK